LRLDVRRGAEIQRVKARAASTTTTTAVATVETVTAGNAERHSRLNIREENRLCSAQGRRNESQTKVR
jgi:hypothetical protein